MQPKVSVITTVHNIPEYCLLMNVSSVKDQTMEDIEIIYVLDKTSEENENIIRLAQASDPRIKVIQTEGNKPLGYGRSFNTALMAATGKYIGIVDGDDYVDNTFFEVLYKEAERAGLSVVKGNVLMRDEFDKITANLDILSDLKGHPYKFTWQHWSAIYEREFLYNNNLILFPGTSKNTETLFLVRLGVLSPIIGLNETVFYNYVKRPDSMDSDKLSSKKILDSLKVRTHIVGYMGKIAKTVHYDHYSWVVSEQFRRAFIESTRCEDDIAYASATRGIISMWQTFNATLYPHKLPLYYKGVFDSLKEDIKDLNIDRMEDYSYLYKFLRGSEYVPPVIGKVEEEPY